MCFFVSAGAKRATRRMPRPTLRAAHVSMLCTVTTHLVFVEHIHPQPSVVSVTNTYTHEHIHSQPSVVSVAEPAMVTSVLVSTHSYVLWFSVQQFESVYVCVFFRLCPELNPTEGGDRAVRDLVVGNLLCRQALRVPP
jgi:hypothetical protein